MADVSLAGRLVAIDGLSLRLADALSSTVVELAREPTVPLEIGSWLLVSGQASTGGGLLAATVEQIAPGRITGGGDFMRFARTGQFLAQAARAKRCARELFDGRGFVEVATPIRVQAPGTDVYIAPHRTEDGWLITSPEFQMKRMLCGGFSKIYQFATCTREEEAGAWHQPEFTLLEWYRSFASIEAVMADTEQLVHDLTRAVSGANTLRAGNHQIALNGPFERLTVEAAFRRYAGIDDVAELAEANEGLYFELLISKIEPALATLPHPVFLHDYPSSQAALARKKSDDSRFAERFELYIAGVELCNGYGELTDPIEQRERFTRDQAIRQARGLPDLPLDEALLDALHEGLPPCSGNALGFERLLALILGVPLRDVVAFPR